MQVISKKSAYFYNALVLPGLGQFLLQRRIKGFLFMLLSLCSVFGLLVRYAAVVFFVLNGLSKNHSPMLRILLAMKTAWTLDKIVLLSFMLAFVATWALALIDLAVEKKKES